MRIQLFLHGGDFGDQGPQFGKDLGFCAFELPFYRLVLSYMFVAEFPGLRGEPVGALHLWRHQAVRTGCALSRSARIQLVILVGVLVLLKAVAYWWTGMSSVAYARRQPFTGAGYTDINAVLPAKMILMAIAVICAAAVFSAIVLRDLRIPAIGLVLLLLSSLIVGAAWPLIVEQISVKPNAAQKEREYISPRSCDPASLRPDRRSGDLPHLHRRRRQPPSRSPLTAPPPPTSGCSTRRSSARRSPSSSRARTSTTSPTSCPSTATYHTALCATTSSRPANSTRTA